MTGSPSLALSTTAAAMAGAGFVFGYGYFAALRRCVALLMVGRDWHRPAALTALRIVGGTAFFFVAAKIGAVSLFATTVGFFVARAITVRAARRAP